MFQKVLNNTDFYFDKSYSQQILTPPLNLSIWCQIPAPSFITTFPTLQQSSKQILKNYQFCRKYGNDGYDGGWGGGGSYCLRYGDTLRTKIDMGLIPKLREGLKAKILITEIWH